MSKRKKIDISEIKLVVTNPSSSSSSVSDNTLAPTNEELGFTPIGSSSSETYPNTTTHIKSSSTATIEPKKKLEVKIIDRNKNTNKPGDNTNKGGKSKPTGNNIPYTPPNSSAGLRVGNNDVYDRSSMYSNERVFEEEDKQGPDEHRTVLQALMGWDDIPMGNKWNHFLQHGFTGMHGKPLQEVLQMAQLETSRGGSSSVNQRAKETHRRTIAGQWDKLLSEWNTGRYASGDEYTVQEFFKEANRLKQAYADAGYNPNELRNPSINAGGFQQGFQKNLQDDRNKVDWIGGLLSSIQNHTASNPDWLNGNQATVMFDKLSEYVILSLAQSKGAIADAEKVRAQIESMPRKDRLLYENFMKAFFNVNLINQVNSMAIEGNATAAEYENLMLELMELAEQEEKLTDKNGDLNEKGRDLLGAVIATNDKIFGKKDFIPIDLDNATKSYDSVLDAFDNYILKNANVDREFVWNSALDIYDINKTNYNDKIGKLGLNFGWDHKGHNLDRNFGEYLRRWQDEEQPKNEVMSTARLYARPIKGFNKTTKKAKKRGGLGG